MPLTNNNILMVAPDLDTLGGIGRVVRIWRDSNFFRDYNITFCPSVTIGERSKYGELIKELIKFINFLFGNNIVYIHTSSYTSFYRKSLFILISIIAEKKILLHIHPSHFYDFLINLNWYNKNISFFILRHILAFIVLSKDMQIKMKTIFPYKDVFILPNGVDLGTMVNVDAKERSANRLLYLGRYVPGKGVYDLVDAVELLIKKGIQVYVDFYGTKQEEKYRSYVFSKNLSNYISVNSWIGEKGKINALYECTALVLPSYSEGLPNVIIEAMATKTPIISTLAGGLVDFLKNEENAIIFEAGNITDLSLKIENCINNKLLRIKISEAAYHVAVNNFDIFKIKTTFANIINFL